MVMLRLAADKYDHIDFKPPKSVADAAERGLEYRKKANPSDKGGLTPAEASEQGIGSGVQRATNLKNRTNVSPEVIRQMCAFFSRHEKNKGISAENKATPWKDKGHVAWLLWGGDPGKTWAEKVRDQMDRADEKAESKTASDDVLKRPEVKEIAEVLKNTLKGLHAYDIEGPKMRAVGAGIQVYLTGDIGTEPDLSGRKKIEARLVSELSRYKTLIKEVIVNPYPGADDERPEVFLQLGVVLKKADKTAHGLIDHELVNDLASAYRGKRMRDGIRDMEMAGMPEQVAERFYEALGEHADEVRGELHRIIEASGPCQCGGNCGGSCGGGSCDCGCGSDCPCMKSRVARRYVRAALKKPLLVLENKAEGFEVHVVEGHGGKFHVVLFDTDAQEYFPSVRAYPTLERAEAEAKKIVHGDGPGHARLAAKPADGKKHYGI